jgi:hypothetical protein
VKTYEVLEKALVLIEDEQNWTQGEWGFKSGPSCAVGAVARTVGTSSIMRACKTPAVAVLEGLCDGPSRLAGDAVEDFNDHHTHAEVVELFQRAVREEKAKEGIEVPLVSERPAEPIAVGASRG